CLLSARIVWSEEIIRSIDWRELAAAGLLTSGTVITAPVGITGPSLRVVHESAASARFPLATIERPGITATRYAIRGSVKYQSAAAGSYLEILNYLPDGAFFTRTMDESGPLQRLEGSSSWRAFELPFVNRDGGAPPDKLVINLVMGGTGSVELGP